MSKKKAMFFSDGAGYDADYQAILDEADVQIYTKPSLSQRDVQNQLVLDLKTAGVWSKLDILHVFTNDGSKEFGSLNWITPTANAVINLANISFASNVGYAITSSATGSISYTPSTDAVNFTASDASYGFKLGAEGGNTVAGSDYILDVNTTYDILLTNGTNVISRLNTGSNTTFGAKATIGSAYSANIFTVIDKNGSTEKFYRNASEASSKTNLATAGLPTSPINYFSNSGSYSNQIKLVFIGAHLTSTEITDFDTAITDYLNNL